MTSCLVLICKQLARLRGHTVLCLPFQRTSLSSLYTARKQDALDLDRSFAVSGTTWRRVQDCERPQVRHDTLPWDSTDRATRSNMQRCLQAPSTKDLTCYTDTS